MNSQRFLELAPKIDNRYLALVGKPYEISHKRGKVLGEEKKGSIYPKLAKELGVTEYVVRAYLRVYHLPSDCLRDIESGRSWNYYETALSAPTAIRQLAYQKIKDNEFSSKEKLEEWIKQYKNVKPKEEFLMKNIPFIQPANQLIINQPESFAEQLRQLFRVQDCVDVEEVAEKRAGRTPTDKERTAVISTVYNIVKGMEKELGKKVVREGMVFRMVPVLSQQPVAPVVIPSKTKTAVLVVREVRDGQGARYELDVVGEFNRGMMKEALKQLMEVFI